VVGKEASKIKRLANFLDVQTKELTFSAPAKIFGFTTLPAVGSAFKSFSDKKDAEQCACECQEKVCQKVVFNLKQSDEVGLPLIIKADVAGTLEALEKELAKIHVDKVIPDIYDRGVGAITENDIKLISAFPHARIIGFKTKIEKNAQALAEKAGVQIKTSDIIYKLSEWLEEEMKAIAPKVTSEETVGKAKILKTFGRNKDKQVIGGQVSDGQMIKGKKIKVLRREVEIGRGEIVDLQMQKIKTHEVSAGNQFGAEISCKIEIAPGDIIEVFDLVTK